MNVTESSSDRAGSRKGRMSRRDFAQLTVLGAAVPAVLASASAKAHEGEECDCTEECVNCCDNDTGASMIDIDQLTDPARDAPCYVGDRCARFLWGLSQKWADITIEQLVYQPFKNVVEKLNEINWAAPPASDRWSDGDRVNVLIAQLFADVDGTVVTYADLFRKSRYSSDGPFPYDAAVEKVFNRFRSGSHHGSDTNGLEEFFPHGFLAIDRLGDRQLKKAKATQLLTHSPDEAKLDPDINDAEFRERTGHIQYLGLFQLPRRESCKPPEQGACFKEETYFLVRKAFKRSIFGLAEPFGREPACDRTTTPPANSQGNSTASNPNDRCYYAGDGCAPYNNAYCALVDGAPTASTDICG